MSLRPKCPALPPFLVLLALFLLTTGCTQKPTAPEAVENLADRSTERPVPDQPFLERVAAVASEQGIQPSGALYEIQLPDAWNGDLVVYAHGYVRPDEPLALPNDQVDGVPVHEIITGLGYAYATTSYRRNGLVIPDAVNDVRELVDIFRDQHPQVHHVFVAGVSEGALVATLEGEEHPDEIDGVLAGCGPIGNFRGQLNYIGNFRLVFDYFFPIIPGSPVAIPTAVIQDWEAVYKPQVIAAIYAYPHKTEQLLRVTHAPIDATDPSSIERTVIGLLEYNIYGTNDAVAQLGGQPLDNRFKFYRGSDNDFLLNLRIRRVRADAQALQTIASQYETTGKLALPLSALHTTGDEIVPYWHAPLYRLKALWSGSSRYHSNIPVLRYGHCEFTQSELLAAFAILVFKATAQDLLIAEHIVPSPAAQARLLSLADNAGARPQIVPEERVR